MESVFVIGIIRGSFGLSGKLKVESTSGEYEHFFKLTDVTLRKGEKRFETVVEAAEIGTSCLFIKLKGIDSPEQAKAFSSWEIEVPRSMACPLNENEYYAEDLKGCTLVYCGARDETADTSGEADAAGGSRLSGKPMSVGVVTGVLEGGAGDLLEVDVSESLNAGRICTDKKSKLGTHKGQEKPKARTVLVPFKKEFIGTVDIEHGTIQLMHLWILE